MARVGYKKVRRGSGLGTRKVRVGGVGRVQGRCGAGRGSGLGKEGAVRGVGRGWARKVHAGSGIREVQRGCSRRVAHLCVVERRRASGE
mgnify:CR=1 FL=1